MFIYLCLCVKLINDRNTILISLSLITCLFSVLGAWVCLEPRWPWRFSSSDIICHVLHRIMALYHRQMKPLCMWSLFTGIYFASGESTALSCGRWGKRCIQWILTSSNMFRVSKHFVSGTMFYFKLFFFPRRYGCVELEYMITLDIIGMLPSFSKKYNSCHCTAVLDVIEKIKLLIVQINDCVVLFLMGRFL